jgi:hypothetical protein
MLEPSRRSLRNASRRPVELHLSSGVHVLPSGERIEVSGAELHCRVLEKRGVLTRHKPASEQPERPARKTQSKPRKKPTAPSTSKRRATAKSSQRTSKVAETEGASESNETSESEPPKSRGSKRSRKSKSQPGKK